jgi:hypothetical protein
MIAKEIRSVNLNDLCEIGSQFDVGHGGVQCESAYDRWSVLRKTRLGKSRMLKSQIVPKL